MKRKIIYKGTVYSIGEEDTCVIFGSYDSIDYFTPQTHPVPYVL